MPTLVGRFSLGLGLTFLLIAAAPTEAQTTTEIGPEDQYCTAINALGPGDELVLRPGEYRGACAIHAGGKPGSPIVIRAKDLQRRPHIVYSGRNANVIEVRASHVVIRGLDIGPTDEDVDGVRIYVANDVTVEQCRFTQLKGIAVVANHASVRKLTVRHNQVLDTDVTAMYFGCHDGLACALSELTVEGNYIHTVRAVGGGVGYGMQVKLNSVAAIRDNVIVDTKGPGIMVYGSRDLDQTSMIERNFVMGSQTSSGILIGGGPAVVRNNVALGNSEGGIGLQDYGNRGLLRRIVIAHNTLYQNGLAGLFVPETGVRDALVVNNAIHSRPGGVVTLHGRPGLRLSGNVDCSFGGCFADPTTRDFSPSPVLIGLGDVRIEPWVPPDDFYGTRRRIPPTVGALEQPAGPIPLGLSRPK